MAEPSASRPEPKSLKKDAAPLDDGAESDEEYRFSTSTGSHRHSYYDQQRVGRRSRPQSGESQTTSKSGGKRGSYQQPAKFDNLNEDAIPLPSETEAWEDQNRSRLEDARTKQVSAKTEPETKKFSRQASAKQQTNPDQDENLNLSELAAGQPVETSPSTRRTSVSSNAQKRRLMRDAERGEDADSGASPSPPPFVQRRPEDYMKNRKAADKGASKWLTELYAVSYLIFFSFLGTLARLGMQWLTFYPGAPVVTPVLWANMLGSMIMGFLAEDQKLFHDHANLNAFTEKHQKRSSKDSDHLEELTKAERAKAKKTIPLYIGLATGFCGSFTSFSSFARDIFLALSNDLPTPLSHPYPSSAGITASSARSRHNGYSVEALLAVVLLTLALSVGGYIVGAHAASSLTPVTPNVSVRLVRRFLDPSMVILAFGCWLGAVFLAIWPPDRPSGPSSHGTWADETWRSEVLFALVFAPLGCLLRFYASLKLNGLVPAFPLGTFAVNMLGTAVEGLCYDVQHVGVGRVGMAGGGRVGCQVLQGVMDGFCGCSTTVSTWVAEIYGLRRKHAYTYALASVVGALCLMVVIMGSVRWSVGWVTPACNTGYPNKLM